MIHERRRSMMMEGKIRITLTGAAGLILSCKGENILVDPYYSRIRKWQALFSKVRPAPNLIRGHAVRIGTITAIVVSHTHFDHAFDTPQLATYTRGDIIGNSSLDALMAISGIKGRTTVCQGGEVIQVTDDIRVTMVPSVHGQGLMGFVPYAGEISAHSRPPLRVKDYRAGRVFSPKMEVGGRVFLHVASAGFIPGSLKGHSCDVVFLCIPGWRKMKGYPERILEQTRTKTVILFHQDDFSSPNRPGKPAKNIPFADVKGLIQKIRSFSREVKIIVPEIGETLAF